MSKILITGGLGHLGSYLMDTLINHDITIVDNFLTQRYCSLFNRRDNIRFIEADFEELKPCDLDKYDMVIHLAAITDAASSFGNKDLIEEVNVKNTKYFIDVVNSSLVKKFVFPSSTSVYGVASEVVDEDPKYVNPQSPYAESKREIELYLEANCDKYYTLRLGTIAGISRGMRFHTAVNKFCYQSVMGIPLTVWRDVYDQKRPYCSLVDFWQAINMIINDRLEKNTIYNILTGNHTPKEIIDMISIKINDPQIEFVDTVLLNQYNYTVNAGKAELKGFRPTKGEILKAITDTINLLEGKHESTYNRW
tara:strand:+ start:1881 stop:2804 length:924 start_codon:yes stop_codon:yes gene_type:complete